MSISSRISKRKATNVAALEAFGITEADAGCPTIRIVRDGCDITLFTIGYERRDGEQLLSDLRNAGVAYLADIREKPMSRKPDFRASALRSRCESEGIEYGAWKTLGSTKSQRDELKETGDLLHFHKTFRAYATRKLSEEINQLAETVKTQSVALLCYERSHDECHRSVIADLLADHLNARIAAIT